MHNKKAKVISYAGESFRLDTIARYYAINLLQNHNALYGIKFFTRNGEEFDLSGNDWQAREALLKYLNDQLEVVHFSSDFCEICENAAEDCEEECSCLESYPNFKRPEKAQTGKKT